MTTKISNKHELILDFIRQFRQLGAENCFSNGMCYYFAVILRERFANFGSIIMYDQVANHFALKIDDHIYDITGDVTNSEDYNWEQFAALFREDRLLYQRLMRDCVYKVPVDVKICSLCEHSFLDDFGRRICGIDMQPTDDDAICIHEDEYIFHY